MKGRTHRSSPAEAKFKPYLACSLGHVRVSAQTPQRALSVESAQVTLPTSLSLNFQTFVTNCEGPKLHAQASTVFDLRSMNSIPLSQHLYSMVVVGNPIFNLLTIPGFDSLLKATPQSCLLHGSKSCRSALPRAGGNLADGSRSSWDTNRHHYRPRA